MKFFHLSDLHIGKHLFYYSLLEDQKYVFHQILPFGEAFRSQFMAGHQAQGLGKGGTAGCRSVMWRYL